MIQEQDALSWSPGRYSLTVETLAKMPTEGRVPYRQRRQFATHVKNNITILLFLQFFSTTWPALAPKYIYLID